MPKKAVTISLYMSPTAYVSHCAGGGGGGGGGGGVVLLLSVLYVKYTGGVVADMHSGATEHQPCGNELN